MRRFSAAAGNVGTSMIDHRTGTAGTLFKITNVTSPPFDILENSTGSSGPSFRQRPSQSRPSFRQIREPQPRHAIFKTNLPLC